MPKILIVYHSRTGNTEKLAKAIAEGAKQGGVEVSLKRYNEATNEDLLKADAILFGSPTYFSLPSAELKSFIDKSVDIYDKLEGKKGAYFTSAGCMENAEQTLQAFEWVYSHYGIDVVGKLACVEKPGKEKIAEARELGRRVAKALLE
ncbi:MAG: flavodoxin domain-containing protein [Candidatus Aenigmarchaeota archaeon]|nr:flavodoxin domain-containing protein [Candidatus Aenigmarchaeota archaeon]